MNSNEAAYYAVIPSDVRYDPELSPNAKLLYGELTSLCNKTGYCWATNEYFAELYGLSIRTVSRLISKLEERGYIRCEMAATEKGSERRIYAGVFVVDRGLEKNDAGGLDKNDHTPLDKNGKRGLDKNVQQNNTSMNNKQDITPYSPPEGECEPEKEGSGRKKREPYRLDWFEGFWTKYPRKDNKQTALRAWCKLKPDRETCVRMASALERDKHSKQWTKDGGEFIPMASTWLNQRRWENEGIDRSQLPRADDDSGWAPDPEVIG